MILNYIYMRRVQFARGFAEMAYVLARKFVPRGSISQHTSTQASRYPLPPHTFARIKKILLPSKVPR